jgi:mono/diheme cytochrome c family protein
MTRTTQSGIAALALAIPLASWAAAASGDLPTSGRALYLAACAACHGAGGQGAPRSQVGFDVPLPDFTDCSFATREPDGDWGAIVAQGGPARGFSEMMPAFGAMLDAGRIQAVLDEVRTFCTDGAWPRGDLNLPRPLVTEKAYPEDEAVLEAGVTTDDPGAVVTTLVFEKRIRARGQIEVLFPFGWVESTPDPSSPDDIAWSSTLGDLAVGYKNAFFHSLEHGSILSVTGEVKLPTGDEEALGKGTFVFEPFLSYGQLLPADTFLHAQAGFEVPFDTDTADNEAFLRAVFGGTLTSGRWGRSWTPMLELLGARELVSGAETSWDAVYELQVTLNRRQHVMVNAGVRTPITDRDQRSTQVLFYLLWDWYDGGLFAGW